MKNKPNVTISPALDEKYRDIKLDAELQKKHDDLVALMTRIQAKKPTCFSTSP